MLLFCLDDMKPRSCMSAWLVHHFDRMTVWTLFAPRKPFVDCLLDVDIRISYLETMILLGHSVSSLSFL